MRKLPVEERRLWAADGRLVWRGLRYPRRLMADRSLAVSVHLFDPETWLLRNEYAYHSADCREANAGRESIDGYAERYRCHCGLSDSSGIV